MRLIIGIFIWIAVVHCSIAAESSSGTEIRLPEEKSPLGDITIHYVNKDGSGQYNEIWLEPKNHPSDQVLLYKYVRSADLLFSPNEEWLVINDFESSDYSKVILFKRVQGATYAEIKDDITNKVWTFFSKQNNFVKVDDFNHQYIQAISWGGSSKAFLVFIQGLGDIYSPFVWYCIFDLKTLEPSLDLRLMNRDLFFKKRK